MGEAAEDY